MLTQSSLFRNILLVAALVAVPVAMPAQDNTVNAAGASQSMRAARLVSAQGKVTVTDGNNTPADAQTNLPLLQGVQIATGDDGQAEIEFEDGSVARLTPNSTLGLDRLDVAPGQLFVTDLSVLRGLAYFELRSTPEYTYSVNAGGDLISPVENATVRVNFDRPPASIAVMEGTVQVQRANAFNVNVGAGATFRENANDSSRYSVTQEIAADSWDQWNADMDQQAAQQSGDSTNVRNDYAGAQGYGWSDLDNQGTWYDVPGQGQVWQPYVAEDASFDPYGYGSWVWYPGAGYLWASAYPWGWTPYRCGAWSYYDAFGWGWAPGPTCGGFGWGFVGGGFVVNITRWPRGYRPVRVPIARPGPIRPVIPVRAYVVKNERRWNGAAPNRTPRQIAGVTAQPIVPGHMTFAAGGGGNTSLHRDFPIDRTTRAPSMGRSGNRPPNVYRVGPGNNQQPQGGQQQSGQQQNGFRGGQNGAPQQQNGQGTQNGWRGGPNGQPAQQPNSQSQQNGQQGQTPGAQGQGGRGYQQGSPSGNQANAGQRQPSTLPQNNAPAVQPPPQIARPPFDRSQHTVPQRVEGNESLPQQQRQIYTAPPQQQQPQRNYTPPPQVQQQQRMEQNQPQRYSPPPQVQQQRYTPPPPPPQQQQHFSPPPPPPSPPPAPHMSAPAPVTSAPLGRR